jgi:hypothetical protein
MGTEVWHNVAVTDNRYFWLPIEWPGNKKCVLIEHEQPTKASKQGCIKVHACGGVSKYGRRQLILTMGSTGIIKAKSTGVNGEEYLCCK